MKTTQHIDVIMEQSVKYSIGEQDFKLLREAWCLYVDKTCFIKRDQI